MASAYNWSAVAFILAAIGLVVFMLVVPRLLGGRSGGLQKKFLNRAWSELATPASLVRKILFGCHFLCTLT